MLVGCLTLLIITDTRQKKLSTKTMELDPSLVDELQELSLERPVPVLKVGVGPVDCFYKIYKLIDVPVTLFCLFRPLKKSNDLLSTRPLTTLKDRCIYSGKYSLSHLEMVCPTLKWCIPP